MPPNYSKKKCAELNELLSLRALQTGGTKIQMISRLVKQDKDDEDALKATNEGIKAASTMLSQNATPSGTTPAHGYPNEATGSVDRIGDMSTGTGADSEVKKRVRKGRSWAEKRAKEAREKSSGGAETTKSALPTEQEQDDFIRSLIAGQSDHSTSSRLSLSSNITVNMTQKARPNSMSSASTSAASKLHGLALKRSGTLWPVEEHTGDVVCTTAKKDGTSNAVKKDNRAFGHVMQGLALVAVGTAVLCIIYFVVAHHYISSGD
jgi:hypothetical protein